MSTGVNAMGWFGGTCLITLVGYFAFHLPEFRKVVYEALGLTAICYVVTAGYSLHQQHRAAEGLTQLEAKQATYPVCGGTDPKLTFLESGGMCNPTFMDHFGDEKAQNIARR